MKNASEERGFDLNRFGQPDYVSGNDEKGYSVSWYFKSEDGKKNLDVMVTVSPIDVDFTGAPFVLDCSLGRDQEVRQGGFGYLCRQNEKGKGKINPEKQDQH